MNNQNILKYKGTKLEGKLDKSEIFDFELIDSISSIVISLDNSEFYDFILETEDTSKNYDKKLRLYISNPESFDFELIDSTE